MKIFARILAVLAFLAFARFVYVSVTATNANTKAQWNEQIIKQLETAEAGDILQMQDNRICVVVHILKGRAHPKSSIIRMDCGLDTHEGVGLVNLSRHVVSIIKPGPDPVKYNNFAGAFVRQFRK